MLQQTNSINTAYLQLYNTDRNPDANAPAVLPNFMLLPNGADGLFAAPQSVFVGNVLVVPKPEIVPYQHKTLLSTDWVLGIILLLFLLFGLLRTRFDTYFLYSFNALFSRTRAARMFLSSDLQNAMANLLMSLIFVVSTSLLAYYNLRFFTGFSFIYGNLVFYVILSFSVFLIFEFKKLVIRFLGFLLYSDQESVLYVNYMSYYNRIAGITLIPFVFASPYVFPSLTDSALFISIIVWLFFYLFGLFRGSQIIISKGASIFYLILYLCAFEILPILVVAKMVVNGIA